MSSSQKKVVIERSYETTMDRMWELWTTAAGIESWWGPRGFRVDVMKMELRPGGPLHYAMTAVAPEMVEYMNRSGLPLTNEAHATFTAVEPPHRIAYDSLVDFVPDVAPYTISNDVRFTSRGSQVTVTMTVDELHDAEWTGRLAQGRNSQLDKLAEVL